MKICLLANHSSEGHEPESLGLLAGARALAAEGHDVLLVSPEDASAHRPGLAPRFIRRLLDRGPEETPPAPLFAPDILHAQHPFLAGEEALRLAAEHDLPLVFTAGRARPLAVPRTPVESAALLTFVDALDVCFANRCDAVVTPCAALAVRLFERGVTRPIHVVPDADDAETAGPPARRLLEIYAETIRQRRARGGGNPGPGGGSARLERELALAWSRVHPSDTTRARRSRGAFASFRDGVALTC